MAVDPEELASFAEEVEEHLKVLEDEFLKIEKAPEQAEKNSINLLFRAAHTIKGCASFLDLRNITQVTHVMETLLDKVRNDQIVLTGPLVDGLLSGLDTLKMLTADLQNCDDEDISDVEAMLNELVTSSTQKEEKVETKSGLPTPITPPQAGPDANTVVGLNGQEIDLSSIPVSYQNVYFLTYGPGDWKSLGNTPEHVIQNLAQTGKVVDMVFHQETSQLWMVFVSAAGPEIIELIAQTDADKAVLFTTRKPRPVGEETPEPAAAPEKSSSPKLEVKVKTPSKSIEKREPKEEIRQKESIRINVELLDHLMRLAGELVLVRNQQLQAMGDADTALKHTVQRLNNVTSELQETIMRTRMQPVGVLFNKYPRIVRDLGKKLSKQIELEISGNEVELDKNILEKLADPLTHLIRNSCDHGIEPPHERLASGKEPVGKIMIHAFHEGGQIHMEIRDNGRGLNHKKIKAKALERGLKTEAELERMSDHEVNQLILLPGFSTADSVSTVSGRGVGMDVVKENISSLGGVLDFDSRFGEGTTIRIRLPLTLAILPSLIVGVGELKYAIPQVNVEELICLYDDQVRSKIESAGGQEVFRLRDKLLPLVRLNEVFNNSTPFGTRESAKICDKYRKIQTDIQKETEKRKQEDPTYQHAQSVMFASLKVGAHRFGLIVDRIIGTEEIVVKPVHNALKGLKCFSGATVMGDGSVALILDVQGIAKHANVSFETIHAGHQEVKRDLHMDEKQNLLLFRAGKSEQFAIPLAVIKRVETIENQQIERVGDKEYYTVDGVSTLVLRLEHLLKVSPTVENENMFLLLPNHIKRPFGILLSEIIDIEETIVHLNSKSHVEDGIVGTSLIRKKMTILPDIYRLIEIAEPSWFADKNEEKETKRPLRILLVEDSLFFRQLVSGYFEASGYEVITAVDGKEGFEVFEKENVDLIVSDIQMPHMDGVEFIRKVRNESHNKRIPAIALTSLKSDRDKDRAMRAGFNYYEIKLEREQLLQTVKECSSHIHV
ncbi:MAG: chemotaxis protein CheW [Acidobacteria bacterium]|nr:chemotaxis protein CheW [Acidobacteriota bacterium]